MRLPFKISALMVLMMAVSESYSANLNINYSLSEINQNNPVVIGCQGMSVPLLNTTQCCVGNACDNLNNVNLLQSTNQNRCPKLVIDGNLYNTNASISVYHSIEVVDMVSGQAR